MVKKITSLNLDHEVVDKAKRMGLNLSEVAENALKKKFDNINVEIETSTDQCYYCSRVEEKATREKLIGLTWLWPDEKWICSSCLRRKAKGITH